MTNLYPGSDRQKARAAAYYQEHKEERIEYGRQRREADPKRLERAMLYSATSRAKRLGLPFDITIEDILIPDVCPYLGIEMIKGVGKLSRTSPTLDRINPELGYVKGNIQVISYKANAMKQDCGTAELIRFARAVLQRHEGD